jgi:antitoxin component YwqK of YwqJK toxin-antitoxin module
MSRIILFLFLCCSTLLSAQKNPENKKRGKVTVYYQKGKQIWYTGQNNNSLKEGKWTYYAPNGKVTHIDNYKAGKLSGERFVFMDSIIISHENFLNGKPDGTQRYYYNSGKINSIQYFTAGMPDSASFFYDGADTRYRFETYSNKKITSVRNYGYHGFLESTEYYENELRTGTWLSYRNNDTTIKTFITYKNNRKNGFCREYVNHNLVFETTYINDTLNGPFKFIYVDSKKLKSEGSFKNGKTHGLHKSYLIGQLIEETTFDNGTEKGISTTYSEVDGRIITKRYFSDKPDNRGNTFVDSVFNFNENGVKIAANFWTRQTNPKYNAFNVTHKITEWYDNKSVRLTGQYVNESQDGEWIEYYRSGKPTSKLNYSIGQLNGKAEFWYENGQKALEFNIRYNEVDQVPKVWRTNGQVLTKDHQAFIENLHQFDQLSDIKFRAFEDQEPMTNETRSENYNYGVSDNFENSDSGEQFAEPPSPPSPMVDEINSYYSAADCFPGGESAMKKYIEEQIIYPGADWEFGNQGMIGVSLILDTNNHVKRCSISHYFNTKSIQLTEEALRLVKSMPWKVPVKNGIPVSVAIAFQITFTLPPNN